jgi:hypothetical protein
MSSSVPRCMISRGSVSARLAWRSRRPSTSSAIRARSSAGGLDGRIAAATTAVGSTLCSIAIRDRTRCARSSTSRREWWSTPSTESGSPKLVNERVW